MPCEEQSVGWSGVWGGTREYPLTREFFEFQIKNAGFYVFLLHKSTCGQKPRPRGLTRPPGVEDVKHTGVENRAVPDLLLGNPAGARLCWNFKANPAVAGAGFHQIIIN